MSSAATVPHRLEPVTDPDTLGRLVAWGTYWKARPQFFGDSLNRAQWFLRTRRALLIERGLLFEAPRGYMVDAQGVDAAMPALIGVQRLVAA